MNQWTGKKVAFLGDSVSDKHCFCESTKLYWEYLQDYLGLHPISYAVNGKRWQHIIAQTQELQKDHGSDVDAVCVFAGTNDFGQNIPLGEWRAVREEDINYHGETVRRLHHILSEDMNTIRGAINASLRYLKENFPLAQIILFTPIHRGKACFSAGPIPDESFTNGLGVFFEEYVDTVRQAGSIWSVPVIDLYEKAGLFPVLDAYVPFFQKADTDRLHPSSAGHERIAKTLMYQMLALPSTFR